MTTMNIPFGLSSDCEPWYAIHCKPRKEFYTANALRSELKLSVFLPECNVRLRGKVQRIPFFPGYLFVQADLHKVALSRINATSGVVRLVEFGGEPQSVPRLVIETIVEEMNRLNSISHLPQHKFRPGDLVRVKNGSLQDLEMVFVGPTTPSKRAHVLLHFLGSLKKVQLDVDALEEIPDTLNLHPERYTREQGRNMKYSV